MAKNIVKAMDATYDQNTKYYLLWIHCPCGEELIVENPNKWEINLVGMIQFKCPKCGTILNIPDGLRKAIV